MTSTLLIDANVGLHSGAKSRETRFVPLIAFASFAFDRVADFSGIPLKQLNKIGSENILSSTKQALAKDKVQIFRAVSSHEVVAPHLVRQRRLESLTPVFCSYLRSSRQTRTVYAYNARDATKLSMIRSIYITTPIRWRTMNALTMILM